MKGFLVAALGLLAPLASSAQTLFDVQGLFDRVDTDRDGRLSPAEIRPDSSASFARYDLDGDGVLSRKEIRAQQWLHGGGPGAATVAQFEMIVSNVHAFYDVDGDGRLTREDYIQRGISQILLADDNRDGVVTIAELRRHHGQVLP